MSSSVRTLMLSCIFRVLFQKLLLGLILKAQVHVPTKAKHFSLFICGRNRTRSAVFEVGENSRQCAEKGPDPSGQGEESDLRPGLLQRRSELKVRLGTDLKQTCIPVRGDGFWNLM